jgi:MtrB/PioB family decaheme-associated outer membrane protein
MKPLPKRFAIRAAAIAVPGALAALLGAGDARADDELVRALTQPTNLFEIGGLYVDDSSSKFGEYNGLDKEGGYAIANFELYGGGGAESAFRWRVLGTDLGLDTRNILAEMGVQGLYRITIGYDEIPHRYPDTYTTIFNGVGSTSLTLPAGYPAASTRLSVTNTAAGILANWNNIQTPNATATTVGGGPAFVIPANMHKADVGTERKKTNLGFSFELPMGWQFKASAKHEDKDGTKLTGVNIGRFNGVSAIVPEPISSSTDQVDISLGWIGERGYFTLGYYGSIYRNDINLWTVENPGANNSVMNNVARLMGYPDNEMHQFNLSGRYNFTPTTRLTVAGSYARLTQNEQFIDKPAGSTWVYPDSSAHAKVINTYFQAKLSSRPIKPLNLNATYKYEDRDNRTPVVSFLTTGGDAPGTSTLFTNEPLNRRLQQFNLDAEYALGRGQSLRGEYEWQEIRRTANGEETPFRADKTHENTLRLEYHKTLADTVSGRIGYSYSERRVKNYEEGNSRPTNPPPPLPAADPALTGFEQFFLANRNRDKLRSLVNWDVNERLSLQAGVDYNRDRYPDTQFGLQNSEGWALNLTGSGSVTDTFAVNGFYTYEDMKVRLDSLAIARGLTSTNLVPHVSGPPCAPYTNAANTLPADYATDPCRQWSETQKDQIHTFGLGFQYAGLLGGRLVLNGDIVYAHARTPISVSGGTYYNTGVPNSPTGNVFIPASSFSDITSELTDIQVAGTYAIDKRSAVRLMYRWAHLKSADWQYDAYTNSALGVLAVQNFIGPGITSPNYTVNVVGLSYIYRWQ